MLQDCSPYLLPAVFEFSCNLDCINVCSDNAAALQFKTIILVVGDRSGRKIALIS